AQITEAILLQAFTDVAQPSFKQMLKKAPEGFCLDLDLLGREKSGRASSPESQKPTPVPDRVPSSTQSSSGGMSPGTVATVALDDSARELLRKAAYLAQSQGNHAIRQPHLFVALIDDGRTDFGRELMECGIEDIESLKARALSLVPSQSSSAPADGGNLIS